jgi:hypothetical protein
MNQIIHPIEPEEVMAYLDGELPADRASATAAHLGECTECQNRVSEFRNVSENLKTWRVQPAKSGMPAAIATALAAKRSEARNLSPVHRPSWREILTQRWPAVASMGALAAMAVFVYVGTLTLRGGGGVRQFKPITESRPSDRAGSQGVQNARSAPGPEARARHDFDAPPQGDKTVAGAQLQQFSKLSNPPAVTGPVESSASASIPASNGPMIIRTAQFNLTTREFDTARANLEAILKRHRGYIGELKIGGAAGSGRTLTATLRVPADQLDAMLSDVKTLGRVESESQSGQDVTSQYVDLEARLANARTTEQRLTDLLRNRTGKLSDVLEVEQEVDRVRGQIEQMEAERKTMANQVSFATLNATITEDYQARLQVVPPSTFTRLRNAAVEGYRDMVEGMMSVALFLLSNGPSLLLWGAVLFLPGRLVWKRVRRSLAA